MYDTISDPYQHEDGKWGVDVLLFDEEGNMANGGVTFPTLHVAQEFLKYFRNNVDPMDNQAIGEFIEKHRRRTMQ